MKRISTRSFPLLLLLFYLQLEAQKVTSNRIYSELNTAFENGIYFHQIQVFEPVAAELCNQLQTGFSKASYWNYQNSEYQKVELIKPERLSFQLSDYQDNVYTLLLQKQEVFDYDSRLLSSDGQVHRHLVQEGIYYRGIIKEVEGSIAALSFFEDQVIAVLSLPEIGNIVMGKLKSSDGLTENPLPHVLYFEKDLPVKSGFQCGVSDLIPESILSTSTRSFVPDSIYSDQCKTTKIFLECDYRLYQDHNRNISQVRNYISGLFNVVKTLYYNELVDIQISDIMIWTSQDPFLHTNLSSIIYHYADYRRNNFTGNLAQLVTTYPPQQQGGIAFLGTLCQAYNGQSGPHSFAYIYNNYNQLPAYSWSVEVMTHELGHNFGSPHTHACFWGPNRDMTLDNCQNPENNACAAGPPALGGGTIMSYCHLTSYGINFSKGFGDEPGNLIRNNVQSKSCLSKLFIPAIESNITKPYYEGDNLVLKARPSQNNYSYNWFHYDYLMDLPKDSVLKPTYSGIYKSAISSDRCTEYSLPDTVLISDFLVNLGCPVIHGIRDSVFASLTMNITKQGTLKDTLMVPDSLYSKIPQGVKDILVELQVNIVSQGNSWTRDVTMAYQAPPATGIINNKFNPNASEPAGANAEKKYSKILGRFNPKGEWYFTTNYSRFVNGINSQVTFSVVISWRKNDSIPPCSIPICEGKSKTFDAKIPGANYQWSTGAITKTVTVNQPGELSLQVTKGSKKASHTVTLYSYPSHYDQAITVCSGETLRIGKNLYTESGIFTDTLVSILGCDSILTTTLNVLPFAKSYDSVFVCFGEKYNDIIFYRDSVLRYTNTGFNGCDSIHERKVSVNPEINIQLITTPACPETGGAVEATATGGNGINYQYLWSDGGTEQKISQKSTGIYSVKVTDNSGCTQEQQALLTNLDSVGLVELIFDVSCYGKSDGRIYLDFISGVSPFNIQWSNNAITKDVLDLQAGTYKVIVADANGCRLIREIEVKSPELLVVEVNKKPSSGNDGSATAVVSGGIQPYIYYWKTGESTQEIKNLEPGDYWVYVYDKNGCEQRIDFTIDKLTSVKDAENQNSFVLYPVPANEHLSLKNIPEVFCKGQTEWALFNADIKSVKQGLLDVFDRQAVLSLAELFPGVYVLELQNQHGTLRSVFIKE